MSKYETVVKLGWVAARFGLNSRLNEASAKFKAIRDFERAWMAAEGDESGVDFNSVPLSGSQMEELWVRVIVGPIGDSKTIIATIEEMDNEYVVLSLAEEDVVGNFDVSEDAVVILMKMRRNVVGEQQVDVFESRSEDYSLAAEAVLNAE